MYSKAFCIFLKFCLAVKMIDKCDSLIFYFDLVFMSNNVQVTVLVLFYSNKHFVIFTPAGQELQKHFWVLLNLAH